MLASENFVRRNGLEKKAVEIIAQEMITDLTTTFEENSCIKMVSVADYWHLVEQHSTSKTELKLH